MLYCDKDAISIAPNPIKARGNLHFIKEKLDSGQIFILRVPSHVMFQKLINGKGCSHSSGVNT